MAIKYQKQPGFYIFYLKSLTVMDVDSILGLRLCGAIFEEVFEATLTICILYAYKTSSGYSF